MTPLVVIDRDEVGLPTPKSYLSSYAIAINDAGDIAGIGSPRSVPGPNGLQDTSGLSWIGGRVRELPGVESYPRIRPRAIRNDGLIVGSCSRSEPEYSDMFDVPDVYFCDGTESWCCGSWQHESAVAVNSAGQVLISGHSGGYVLEDNPNFLEDAEQTIRFYRSHGIILTHKGCTSAFGGPLPRKRRTWMHRVLRRPG
jgi:hypothetical protein